MYLNFLLIPIIAVLLVVGSRTESTDLKELNVSFTFRGKPVQPRAIEELTTWISDKHPGPVAIDMEGTDDSNRYYGEVWQRDGKVGFNRHEPDSVFGKGMFSYRHVGQLKNGCHVLHTVSNEGGTGYFESVLLVKFVNERVFDDSGRGGRRVVMKQMGEISLGDRVNAQVKVIGNKVQWTADGQAPHEIRLN